MAWTAPHTWATGQTISGSTAAANASLSLNYQLSGNLLSARNLWDAAIGLCLSTHQSIPNSANTSIVWDRAIWSVNSTDVWGSASGAKLKVHITGRWEVLGTFDWALNTSGRRGARLQINNSTLIYRCGVQVPNINSGNGANQPFGDILELTTGDVVKVLAFQNSGAALNMRGGRSHTRLTWRLIGASS